MSRMAVTRTLAAITGVLFVTHAISELTNRAESLFHLGNEGTLPTVYSTLLLLFSAGLLAVIGQVLHTGGQRSSRYWFGLAAVFTFLAVDEAAEIHERIIEPLRSATDATGLLYYTWVIPYAIALLALVVLYARFLLDLPRQTGIGFIMAGAVYVFGAVVVESLTGLVISSNDGAIGPVYRALQGAEEVLEIVGIIIFIDVLLAFIETDMGGVDLRLARPAGDESGARLEASDGEATGRW